MSKNYTKIKNYYESGMWSIDRVWNVVGKKLGITEDEYKEITGFTYPATEQEVQIPSQTKTGCRDWHPRYSSNM